MALATRTFGRKTERQTQAGVDLFESHKRRVDIDRPGNQASGRLLANGPARFQALLRKQVEKLLQGTLVLNSRLFQRRELNVLVDGRDEQVKHD